MLSTKRTLTMPLPHSLKTILRKAAPLATLLLFISVTTFAQNWVGTWTTSPQLVEPHNNPPSPGLSDNTIRQIFKVSIGGDSLRMRFSNEFSNSAVTMKEVHIAISTNGLDSIDTSTDKVLLFEGSQEVTMEAGGFVFSDPLDLKIDPLTTLAVTIYFGDTSSDVTGHPGSRTTSYILTGNHTSDEAFDGATTTDHWYVINTLEVTAPDSTAAIVIIGDSITDGRGSGTNKQNRWPDELAKRLQANPETQNVAVLNAGIGGNCVLGSCLGPSALARFERDVLNQNGVRWLIILEGVNDIGYGSATTGDNLITAYKQMLRAAHEQGIYVYGATILPFKGSGYFSDAHETSRQTVNQWMRSTSLTEGLIDLDKALRDPADTLALLPAADDGDGLHPSEEGHRMMGEAVDLDLFVGREPLEYSNTSISLYYEAECGIVGSDWNTLEDSDASNGRYISVIPGTESLRDPPADSAGLTYITVQVDTAGEYNLYGRVNNPTYDDDSFWVKVDNNAFVMYNSLVTTGWGWVSFGSFELSPGEHVVAIGYREDGAALDKLVFTTDLSAPFDAGGDALNTCDITSNEETSVPDNYELKQNYPNPFNPSTLISYTLPVSSPVQLSIFDALGREVAMLVDGNQPAGSHEVSFDASGLSSGAYVYRLTTPAGTITKKMMLLK